MISVLILTKNEEANLPACLDSLVPFVDDIHVLDSGSSDGTVAIGRAWGAAVHRNEFKSFAEQRNWAIDHIDVKYDWTFHLDADERFTPELAAEIQERLTPQDQFAGYYVPSKMMLGNKWLRYSGEYPAYQVRLFHRHRLRFRDAGHGQREIATGELGRLKSPYLHFPFSKGLEDWFAKHARYARQEAENLFAEQSSLRNDLRLLLVGRGVERRRAAKRLSYRLPSRGWLRLLHLLFVKRAIFDGRAGIMYARMKSTYETMAEIFIAGTRIGVPLGCRNCEASISTAANPAVSVSSDARLESDPLCRRPFQP